MKMLKNTLYKMKELRFLHNSIRIYQTNTVAVKQPRRPECKFENDDKDCLPRKRCVPPKTVCHTLPKQNCVVNAPIPQKKKLTDIINYQNTSPAKYDEPAKVPSSGLKFLPHEDNMSPAVKMAYRFLKFSTKAVIAGGSVYLTTNYGVWGNSNQTAELYGKAHKTAAALMKDNSVQVPDVPDSREIIATCKHYWNKGVIVSVATLIKLPSMISKWSQQLYGYVTSNLAADTKKIPK